MGSMLHEAVGTQRCFDELNSTQPEAAFAVHQAYIVAGAPIIETNTFGANRFKLAPLGLAEEVQRLNSRGVKIAREARESAAREVLIAGSIGPLGLGVQSRHPADDEILDIFHEQELALEERGVDLYVLETFSYIEELLLAIDAIRSFSGLPIVAQLTYAEEGTIYGDLRPSDAAAQLKNKNVQVIGANCTLGPQALLPILQELAAVDGLRVSGMPNAGFPKREGDRIGGAMARVGMDALIVAGALEARGVETVPHLTTRDQNIIGLQAALLGAWTVGGVRNVLAITGDPPSVGDYPETSGVYEVDSVGLVKVLNRLNQGTDWAGKTLGGATNFTIGVAVNPVADDLDNEIERFHAKVEAGAHFAMTQPLFDPEHWHAFLKKLGGKPAIPVLIGIWPLNSYKQALRLNNEVPGIVIPEELLKSMETAGAAARDRGFEVARKMLAWARTELAGAYLIPPFKRYEEILEIL